MPFVAAPTEVIADWGVKSGSVTLTGDHVCFPVASVPELTALEADAVSGDWRKVLYATCQQFYNHYYELATADKPSQVTLTKTSSFVGGDTFRSVYTFTFNTVAAQEVGDETA